MVVTQDVLDGMTVEQLRALATSAIDTAKKKEKCWTQVFVGECRYRYNQEKFIVEADIGGKWRRWEPQNNSLFVAALKSLVEYKTSVDGDKTLSPLVSSAIFRSIINQ